MNPHYDVQAGIGNEIDGASEEVYVLPSSFAQQRLWFLDQFEPNSPYYNIPAALRLTGRLHAATLRRALNEVASRHESLRTTFVAEHGQPLQVIAPSITLDLPVIDLRHLPRSERDAEARALIDEESCQPFDLRRGPLLRARLLRLEDAEHIALFTLHHIISDGWSMGVFINEVAMLYQAFAAGRPSPLPPLPIQYADFACWQQDWFQGEVLERQLSYWMQRLGDAPPVLELPADHPRPAVRTSQGTSRAVMLPLALAQAITDLARRENATLFMALLTVFQVLLYRYTGQEEISVGTPIAGRNRSEIEGLIGCFINTLVLRADLSGALNFREVLARTREATLGAYAHQDLPFERLVDALQLDRDMSHSPLFQVMFILQNTPGASHALPGLSLHQMDVDTGTSNFDLTLSVTEQSAGLHLNAEYSTDLFEAETIDRLLGHFHTLLEAVVRDPDQSIAALPFLPEAERRQMLIDWNETAFTDARLDLPVHSLFEAQVARTPHALAVTAGDRSLTYAELNERANQLAHCLITRGVGPESVVALALDRSLDVPVAILATLKAGAAYLPLDPLHPTDRLAFMLADTSASVLLTQSHLRDRLPDHAATLCLDTDWNTVATERRENPDGVVTPERLAYVIYTSGSTGQAKGVMVEHRSLVNAFLAWERAYDLPAIRSHLSMANVAFDVFSGDFVRALLSGGRLVLCPRELLLEPDRLCALIQREEIECAEFVPAVLRGLIGHLEETEQRLDGMRVLICGSDSWYVGEYRKFGRYLGEGTRFVNSFGVTEATIDTTWFEGEVAALSAEQMVPIGRPFGNMAVYVLDAHRQPAPIGVPGELYIGGAGVARGYLKRPELTAERFVTILGQRLYRTGDRARWLPDGKIEFLGRADEQVKIRGYRIEPGEIEAALAEHPGVGQAAVVAWDAPGGARLAAYVVARENSAVTGGELRRALKERLPDYMVPSAFVMLSALPLTSNGKVDRRALPVPEWTRPELEGEYVAPRTPVEEKLAVIFQAVLGVEQVGAEDNFFELGGHSLLATQLVSRVREGCGVEIALRCVFETPTVAALSGHVETALRTEGQPLAPPIRPVDRDRALPLSFAQQRLWFLDQLEPGSAAYNMPDTLRLGGRLDVVALHRSLNEVVRRHEVLRTTFPTVDGRPHQEIAPELTLPLPVIDLTHLPREEREAAAERLVQEDTERPFDLARGPLLRMSVLRLGEAEHIAVVTMHHIVSDDWSSQVLTAEIAALYDAFSRGLPSPLAPLPIQYADFACWQRDWLQGEVLEGHLGYWKRHLAGVPPVLDLPTDRPRPSVQSARGSYQSFALPADLTATIRDFCRQEGVTPFMALLAAFQSLLYRYSGQEDLCVGTPIAGRNRSEIEGLIGFFVNTLVMRADLSGSPSFRELVGRVREVSLCAYAHQDVPFEMIVDAVQPERSLSHSPLFQVMFVMQSTPTVRTERRPELSFSAVEAHSGTAKFDLTLFLVDEAEAFTGALEYCTDLFDAATIERMLGHFRNLLTGLMEQPDQPIATVPVLSEAERHQLLVEWNRTEAQIPADALAHELFAEQVARTPEAAAVVCEDLTLTYEALNRRANQLAHYLVKQGVGPETLVALSTDRTSELVVGILGVLKAGAAYVPLDPSYPAERLAFMLADSGAPILLTQSHLEDRFVAGSEEQNAKGETSEPLSPFAFRLSRVLLDSDWPVIASESEVEPERRGTPENLAYCIYTSGSTGRPKGTLIHHRGLVNYLTWCCRAYPLEEGCGAPVHSSISFDLTVTSLLGPLVAGRAVHLLADDLGAETLAGGMREQGDFSLVKITPAHLQLLGQQIHPEDAADRTRSFIIGGENLTAEHVAFWQRHAPQTRLVNEYGPTETVVGCCVYTLAPGETVSGSVPIGRPIINTQLYVLDAHLQPTPIGVPGELYIGGLGVARGYLNRPELTAEKFVEVAALPRWALGSAIDRAERGSEHARWVDGAASPRLDSSRSGAPAATAAMAAARGTSSSEPRAQSPARLYRTGDLARWRGDGNLEFLGRTDDQVKLRGFRIELGEIEATLSRHPEVSEVAVIVREDRPGDRRLVGYVVPSAKCQVPSAESRAGTVLPSALGTRLSALSTELRAYLKETLPDYMVPTAFVTLPSLPLTPNGKVDRKALPAPELERSETDVAFVEARNDAEERLAAIWAEVLGVPQVGVNDNFFELGGDSILSIQVIARANQAGFSLAPRQLFEQPTVAGLAGLADAGHVVHAEQGVIEGSAGLTPIQSWFFELDLWQRTPGCAYALRPGRHHWNQSLLLESKRSLDRNALQTAVGHLIAHHDALRMRFVPGDEGWEARVAGVDEPVPFNWVDLSMVSDAELAGEIERRAGEFQASLDLSAGPLLRVVCFHLGRGRGARLLIAVHHLVMDGVSWPILLEDLQVAYEAAGRGKMPPFPRKSTSFRYWAERLAEHARSEETAAELPFWLEGGDGMAPLPVDFEVGENSEASAQAIEAVLTPEETHALLRDVPPVYRTEINDVLLAALALAVGRWTGSQVTRVELEGHGREDLFPDVDLSRTIGWFTALFPVRIDLGGAEGPGATLQAVKEQLRRIPRRGVGYGLLRSLRDPETAAQLARLPRPEIAFNYLGQMDQAMGRSAPGSGDEMALPLGPASESAGPERSPDARRTHLIDINGSITGGVLQLEWCYSANRHRPETIQRLADDFTHQLRALIAHCQSPDAGGYTASDFQEFDWSQGDLDDILVAIGDTFDEEGQA